jgi:hypothetical protein
MKKNRFLFLAILVAALFAASGCASTRTENGVTIEQRRSGGIPLVPFF